MSASRFRTGIALLIALALGGFVASGEMGPVAAAPPSAPQPKPALQVLVQKQVQVGEPIVLTLRLKRARNIAGFETYLLFDRARAEFSGMELRDTDLRKAGRDAQPLIAQDLPDGIAVGLYSCPRASCTDATSASQERGARGKVTLATIRITPRESGILEIRLAATQVVDAAGNRVQVARANPSLKVQVGRGGKTHHAPAGGWKLAAHSAPATGPFELTGDGQVTLADAALVALEWQRAREQGAPCDRLQEPRADVNHDGCVDSADVQAVAAQMSQTAPRTATPVSTVSAPIETPQATPTRRRRATRTPAATRQPGPTPVEQQGLSFQVIAPQAVAVGEPIELRLAVKGAGDVAGFETHLHFDKAHAEFARVRLGQNQIQQAGRSVEPLIAVDLPDGIAIGSYSCPLADCAGHTGARVNRGANGNVTLATVTLVAQEPGILQVKLSASKFVDAAGNPIQVPRPNRTVQIRVGRGGAAFGAPGQGWQLANGGQNQRPRQLDLSGDAQVTFADTALVAVEWQRAREAGAPCRDLHEPEADVNRDGCVDVADAQLTAANLRNGAAPQAATAALTFTVNTLGDLSDAKLGDRICDADLAAPGQQCTLRAAVGESNGHIGADNIVFALPGSGVQTIQLVKSLPVTDGGTTIDGYTQPGAAPNSDPVIDNAQILIQLRGNGPEANKFNGIQLLAPNNTIRGLALFNLRRGIQVYGTAAQNNTIVGSFIGTDAAGNFGLPAEVAGGYGVIVESGGGHTRIGGPAAADRNVISGNAYHGIATYHDYADQNVIQNNIVGLGPAGNKRLPNRRIGIDINYGSGHNTIGGTGPGERNILSGNDLSGLEISHQASTTQNDVVGNFIGTDVTGTRAQSWTANQYTGITIEDGATNNLVHENVIGNNLSAGIRIVGAIFMTGTATTGNQVFNNRIGVSLDGTPIGNQDHGVLLNGNTNQVGPGNIIAYNSFGGVTITEDDKDGNKISQNSIFGNGGIGIALAPSGVNPNDPGDADTGANEQQNYPDVTAAFSDGQSTTIQGTLNSVPNSSFTLEFFRNSTCDSSGYGEGEQYLGAANVTTDGNGNASLNITLPVSVPVGQFVTATATDSAGNTSEFSACRTVQAQGTLPTPTGTPPVPTNTPVPATATLTPTPATRYASDAFSRTLSSTWGNADLGGAYSLSGTASHFAVNGSTGTINIPTVSGADAARLLAVSAQDLDLRVRVQTNKMAVGGYAVVNWIARRLPNGDEYRGRLRLEPSGAVSLQASRFVGGSETLLGSAVTLSGVSHSAQQWIWLRAQVTGTNPTTLRLKAWVEGQSEPGTWQYTVTDSAASLQTAGGVGLAARLSSGLSNVPFLFAFEDFSVTSP